jgi:hypothetical protein
MKINTKDVVAGGILVLFAVIGLWLNQEHALGTARRMGPGYMPMLVFYLLLGLGAIVVAFGLVNGPDPLEKWSGLEIGSVLLGIAGFFAVYWIVAQSGQFASNYYPLGFGLLASCLLVSIAPAWRPIGLVHAGMAVFGLMLDQLGLMAALVATIAVASLADRDHRPLGVLGMILFLCALCWWVFIKELDIRVAVWPLALTQ